MTKQLSLFSRPTLNVNRTLKERLARSAKESGLSREELLERMNRHAEKYGVRLIKGNGPELGMSSLEKWLNPEDREHMPSINALVIFCAALEDLEPMRILTAPLGAEVIGEQDIKLLLWAREYHALKQAKAKMKRLEAEL